MVCIPCIVIPLVLWVFYKFLQPLILKFWNPWATKGVSSVSAETWNEKAEFKAVKGTPEAECVLSLIKDHPVVLFSKTTCQYCKMARGVFDEIGVSYHVEELDLKTDTSKVQDVLLAMTGVRTVPRVFVGGKCIGGGNETYQLHNEGQLMKLLKEANASFKTKSD